MTTRPIASARPLRRVLLSAVPGVSVLLLAALLALPAAHAQGEPRLRLVGAVFAGFGGDDPNFFYSQSANAVNYISVSVP
jgi:hypothetical protein